MNKLHVAIELFEMLKARSVVDSNYVAEWFGVTVRTAQRYLERLESFPGIEYKMDGRTKQYYLGKDFKFDNMPDPTRLHLLHAILESYSKQMGVLPDGETLFQEMIDSIFPPNFTPVYHILDDNFVNISSINETLSKLEVFISEKKDIRFCYKRFRGWKTGKYYKYDVRPYKIVLDEGFWYLLCKHTASRQENKIRTFVIDYIDEIEETGESYENIPDDIKEMLESSKSIWFSNDGKTTVKLELHKDIAEFFVRKLILPGQKIIKKCDDGRLIVTCSVFNYWDFRTSIINWMPSFKILEPKEYRKEYIEDLKIALETSES